MIKLQQLLLMKQDIILWSYPRSNNTLFISKIRGSFHRKTSEKAYNFGHVLFQHKNGQHEILHSNPFKRVTNVSRNLPVAMVVVLCPEVASVWALSLWLRRGRGSGGRFCPARPLVLAYGRHEVGALDDLPVADVLVAMHVGAVPGPIVGRMVQICSKGGFNYLFPIGRWHYT